MGRCQRLVRGNTEQARMKEECKRCGRTLALDFAISIHCIVGFWKGAIRITTIHSKQVFGF